MRRPALLVALCVVAFAVFALLVLLPQAQAATSRQIVSANGPLTKITLGQDLSCQVEYLGDTTPEIYNPSDPLGDCGTILMVDPPLTGTLYGPAMGQPKDATHTGSAAAAMDSPTVHTIFTYVSQSLVTGAGSLANPYKVVTVVTAGATQVSETDTYVLGDQFFTRTVTLTNNDPTAHTYRVWIAIDCYLFAPWPNNPDEGYGFADPPGNQARVACTRVPNSLTGRYEMLVPITDGSHYMQAEYDKVWGQIGSHAAMPDTVDRLGAPPCPGPAACSPEDNGMGLSWDTGTVPAGGTFTIAAKLQFSPGPPPNQPPTVDFTFNNSADSCQDSRVLFTANAQDSDGFVAKFLWSFGDPAASTSDASGAQFTYKDAGSYTVSLTVTDNKGATATISKSVAANKDTNCWPCLHPIDDKVTTEGQFIRYFPPADDWESDALTYVSMTPLPGTATLDPPSGYLFWRTAEGDGGDYPITIHIDDGQDHTGVAKTCPDTQDFKIHVLPKQPSTPVHDSDNDGIDDGADNCPGVPNAGQADANNNGIGDVCEGPQSATVTMSTAKPGPITPSDSDGDNVPNTTDNCPGIANPDQSDLDHDRIGDVCDTDLDGDGAPQFAPRGSFLDNCPLVPNPDQKDTGNQGVGDACRGASQSLAGQSGDGTAHPNVDGPAAPNSGGAYGEAKRPFPYLAFGAAIAGVALVVAAGTIVFVVRRRG